MSHELPIEPARHVSVCRTRRLRTCRTIDVRDGDNQVSQTISLLCMKTVVFNFISGLNDIKICVWINCIYELNGCAASYVLRRYVLRLTSYVLRLTSYVLRLTSYVLRPATKTLLFAPWIPLFWTSNPIVHFCLLVLVLLLLS